MIKAILKSLLFIPILFVFLISLLVGYIGIISFQNIEYTYAGKSIVTLDQYNEISMAAYKDSDILKIMGVSNDKLTVIYQFNSLAKIDYLTQIKQETQFWPPFGLLIASIIIFLIMLIPTTDLIKWIRNK
ncbi:MAG: hypothetical protein WC516_08435 [Patescibacteria group bacterium]|jgi:hypothetical protein